MRVIAFRKAHKVRVKRNYMRRTRSTHFIYNCGLTGAALWVFCGLLALVAIVVDHF